MPSWSVIEPDLLVILMAFAVSLAVTSRESWISPSALNVIVPAATSTDEPSAIVIEPPVPLDVLSSSARRTTFPPLVVNEPETLNSISLFAAASIFPPVVSTAA